ncbi:hypothetical protein [Enterococcus sp. DIV0876]|uniref:hypothetical protein n=1 Tax=Enterococcus sp. DIV0876 TaxID=2774633 RepID=UPI003D2FF385
MGGNEGISLYTELIMKNLHFLKFQRENVIFETLRLLNKSIDDVKSELNRKKEVGCFLQVAYFFFYIKSTAVIFLPKSFV